MVIPSGPMAAMAMMKGEGEIRGTVKFYPVPCATLVVAELSGLPDKENGFFSIHIHEGADCGGEDYANTGGHFNPEEKSHPSHSGDLPPLMAADGRALLAVETDRFFTEEVIGRTVVIHERGDDLTSQPSGNAGRKIACGVIRWR